jgi:N-hydroxyarylamine O-acetyltransferase
MRTIHAAQCAAIPFENIDVQLAQPPSIDPDQIFAKLVHARRGGWCYEQNGLLGRALTAIGFDVMRICAGVVREDTGLPLMGSHLALLVMPERDDKKREPVCGGNHATDTDHRRPWLVDCGFGSWIGAPLPLEPGAWPLQPWPVALAQTDDGRWQLGADLGTRRVRYIFAAVPADEALLAQLCTWQAVDPASVFTQNFVTQRLVGNTDLSLRGRVLTETDAHGRSERVLDSAAELVAVLRDRFGLNVPHVAQIWPAIVARHAALFPDQAVTPTT